MKKLFNKEVKIGIAFIVALFLLYMGINFLKGVNIFKPTNSYIVVFNDVTELTVSSPVLLNGYQIGLVHNMDLDPETGKINVEINLNKGIKIPKGSAVKLDISLMGAASILVHPNDNTTDYYTSSDKIPGIRSSGLMETVGGIVPQMDKLMPKLDSILLGVNVLVNDPNLAQTLQNVNSITSDLTTSTKELNKLMVTLNSNLPRLANNMITITNDMTSVSGKLKNMDLTSTYQTIDKTLKNIEELTDKLNSKENSLGLLLNDRALYDSLSVTIGGAGQLMKDMKKNPSKYINVKVF